MICKLVPVATIRLVSLTTKLLARVDTIRTLEKSETVKMREKERHADNSQHDAAVNPRALSSGDGPASISSRWRDLAPASRLFKSINWRGKSHYWPQI